MKRFIRFISSIGELKRFERKVLSLAKKLGKYEFTAGIEKRHFRVSGKVLTKYRIDFHRYTIIAYSEEQALKEFRDAVQSQRN